jgi:hypothetical protein
VASYNGSTILATSSSTPLVEHVGSPPTPPPDPATTTKVVPIQFVVASRVWVNLQVLMAASDLAAGPVTGSVQPGLGSQHVLTLALSRGSAQLDVPLSIIGSRIVSAYYPGSASLTASGSPFVSINPRFLPRLNPSSRPGLRSLRHELRLLKSAGRDPTHF